MIAICDNCGREYKARVSEYKRRNKHYCSNKCRFEAQHKVFEENFKRAQGDAFVIDKYIDKRDCFIRCTTCGTILRKSHSSLTQKRCRCDHCAEIKKTKKLKLLDEKRKINEQIKRIKELTARIEKAYKKYENAYKKQATAEKAKENKKAQYKLHELKRENRIKNNGQVDKDISLEALSKGGTHTWDNIRLACFICNSRKGNREYAPT